MTTSFPAAVRAAVLMHRPVQYFAPGLRFLAAEVDIASHVYYWRVTKSGTYDPGFGRHVRWNTDLYSGYDWWSPDSDLPEWRRGLHTMRRLRANRPDVILSFGWHSPLTRFGFLFARATGTPLLFYGDTNGRAEPAGAAGRQRLRGLVLRCMFHDAGAISTGVANRDFYLSHGLPAERIHPGLLPADVEAFAAAAARQDPRPADRPFKIGFVGKFVPAKAVDDLVEAVALLPPECPWELRLIGDGPLSDDLRALVSDRGLTDRVQFLGFRNTDEVPSLVAELDVLVLPSRFEPRGLVAIEAMAAGVVALVSSATGVWGAGDAIEDGVTGKIFPAGEVRALAASLLTLIKEPGVRAQLAASGQARALFMGSHDFASTTAKALLSTARRNTHVLSQ